MSYGFPLWWEKQGVTPPPFYQKNHKGALQNRAFVCDCIKDLLTADAAEKWLTRPRVVNPLNVTPKKNGKLRLILDLRHVNNFLFIPKFKMDSLKLLHTLLQPDDAMFAIDLAHGYHQVQMHPDAYTYLGFEWEGHYYVFKALPFGLASAPWCFTKVMREVAGSLRGRGVRLISYLDDYLFMVPKLDKRRADTIKHLVLCTFRDAGLTINYDKSTLTFVDHLVHLGFLINIPGRCIEVPEERWQAFQSLLQSALRARMVHVRMVASLAGHAISMSLALGPVARLFTRACYHLTCSNPMHRFVRLPDDVRAELTFWAGLRRCDFTTPIWRSQAIASCFIHTDAGAKSWGGIVDGLKAQGYFSQAERGYSSTLRELLAVFHTLTSFGERLRYRRVQLFVDNQSVERIIPAGSMHKQLQALALKIFWLTSSLNVRLLVEWIPREENKAADAITRWVDLDDWQLHPDWFAFAQRKWGPHSIDRFAGHNNHLLPGFNSLHACPGSAGVNAFAQSDWAQHNNWCNPPFSLIPDLIALLKEFKAEATVVVPFWPARPWWPLISPTHGVFAPFVVDAYALPGGRDLFRPGPATGNSVGMGRPRWRVFLLRVSFRDGRTPAHVLIPGSS